MPLLLSPWQDQLLAKLMRPSGIPPTICVFTPWTCAAGGSNIGQIILRYRWTCMRGGNFLRIAFEELVWVRTSAGPSTGMHVTCTLSSGVP